MGRIGLNLGDGIPPSEMPALLEKLRIADTMGVDSVWVGESWGRELIATMGRLAGEFESMRIGSGIANVYSRSPAALAMAFATLDEMTNGRVIYGIGTSGQLLIEGLFGVPFGQPLRRVREYVEIFNALVSGEKLNYEGEIFQLTRGFKLLFKPPRQKIPVYIAAISPAGIRQIGEIADGWMPIWWPKQRIRWGIDLIHEAATKAGRADAPIEIAPHVTVTVVPPGGDRAAAVDEARASIAFYVNRMGRYYWQMLERNGFEAEVQASRAAFAAGDRDGANAAISVAMADEIAISGSAEQCAERLDEWRALGATLPIISMPQGDARQFEQTLATFLK